MGDGEAIAVLELVLERRYEVICRPLEFSVDQGHVSRWCFGKDEGAYVRTRVVYRTRRRGVVARSYRRESST